MMKKYGRAAVLLLCAVLLLTGCSVDISSLLNRKPPDEQTAEEQADYDKDLLKETERTLKAHLKFPETHYTIGLVVSGTDVYNTQLSESVRRCCYVMDITLLEAQGNAEEQPALVEKMLSDGVDALLWRPADESGLKDTLVMLEESGVPYIILDQMFDDETLEAVEREFPYYEVDIYGAGQTFGIRAKEQRIGELGVIQLMDDGESPSRIADLEAGFLSEAGEDITLLQEADRPAKTFAYSCDPEAARLVSSSEWDCILIPDVYGLGTEAVKNVVRLLEGVEINTYRGMGCELYSVGEAERVIQTLEDRCRRIDCEKVWPKENGTE